MEKVKEETSIQFGKDVNLQEDSDGSKVLQSWTTFPVSNQNQSIACNLTCLGAKNAKCQQLAKLEREPVASDNDGILTLQHVYQTFVLLYSSDNHRIFAIEDCCSHNLKF